METLIATAAVIGGVIGNRTPTRMQPPPKRTNATNLSDDELLLFDFFFDKSLSFHHLRIEDYSFHMNCLYSHGLSDADLELTLASLVCRGLVNCKVGKYGESKIATMLMVKPTH